MFAAATAPQKFETSTQFIKPASGRVFLLRCLMALLMSPTSFVHGIKQGEVMLLCMTMLPSLQWSGPVTLSFEDKSNPEPDIIGWRDGEPYVVIEIAVTTQKSDLGFKKDGYAVNKIPRYMVVDVTSEKVHAFKLNQDGAYEADDGYLKALIAAVEKVFRTS
jgi:Uma2 family endonuclease